MTDDARPFNRYEQIMRDAAWDRSVEEGHLHTAIANLVLGPSDRRRTQRIGHIVTVETLYGVSADVVATTGSFVVQVITTKHNPTNRKDVYDETMWVTLHDGKSDSWRWHSVDQALLHLIAQRKGDADTYGTIVAFASRVIGFNDTPGNVR